MCVCVSCVSIRCLYAPLAWSVSRVLIACNPAGHAACIMAVHSACKAAAMGKQHGACGPVTLKLQSACPQRDLQAH